MSAASLVVDNLHKRYGEREVLKGVSLAAKPGDVITLIGSSGSGKSTFLRCLNLLEQPYEGTLKLGSEELKLVRDRDGSLKAGDAAQLQRWRARLAMVFQNFNLWGHRTVLENVIEAPIHVLKQPRAAAIEKAEALLARVGVSHRKDVYPAQLSGGEQQRVASARALAGEVLKVMRDLAAEGRTMIVVTHEMGFAREVSSHTMFLHQGRVEEQGNPREVLVKPQSERLKAFLSGGLK